MESKQRKIYLPWEMEIMALQTEDVVRTSVVDDNYDGWDDEDAELIGGAF